MRRMLACLLAVICALPALGQPAAGQDVRRPSARPQQPGLAPAPPVPQEKVEADISTRSVEVTTGFSGHDIIVFGAVDNSQAPPDEEDYYDIVIVVEGTPAPIVARRKSEVAGLWVNTAAATFPAVPSYYAIASTRPIEEIAGPAVLERHAIGLRHISMAPSGATRRSVNDLELVAFRHAVVRLKEKQGLYVLKPTGVTFAGRSLFRSTIALPANIPVGPLVARTYLFRNGEVVSAHISRVVLHRAGIEWLVHNFAFVHPIAYGLIAVLLAVGAGLLAYAYFRRQPA